MFPQGSFLSSVRGLKAKQPWGEGQGATHLLYKHGEHRTRWSGRLFTRLTKRINHCWSLCARSSEEAGGRCVDVDANALITLGRWNRKLWIKITKRLGPKVTWDGCGNVRCFQVSCCFGSALEIKKLVSITTTIICVDCFKCVCVCVSSSITEPSY